MDKEDGPNNKWTQDGGCSPAGQPAQQSGDAEQDGQMTQQFPTPRLQTDDGNQDVADLHAREDLLLENYSWVDQVAGQGEDSD
jgi:hypothetical protein